MAEQGKISKFQIQKPMDEKNQKNKFEVQTGWDIFKLFFHIYNSTLSSIVNQCIHKVFEKEMVWNQMISFTNKIQKCKKYFNSDSTKF